MSKPLFFVAPMMLALCVGCNEGTSGGPGASQTDTTTGTGSSTTTGKPVYGEADNTFSLDVPNLATTVEQGEMESVTISIDRGDNFSEDVSLELKNVPQGVTVDPAQPSIGRDQKEVTLQITAAADAALGDFTIQVVGHPTKGADATSEFKLTVTENE